MHFFSVVREGLAGLVELEIADALSAVALLPLDLSEPFLSSGQ